MKLRLSTRVHPSWLVAWASLGLLAGAALCLVVDNDYFVSTAGILAATSLLLISFAGRLRWMTALAFTAGCLIGLWRGSELRLELEAYQPYYGRAVSMKGRVSQDTLYGAKGDQRLNLSDVEVDEKQFAGEVWASIPKADIKRGDVVVLKGVMNEGFGNMSATMARAQVSEITRPNPGDVARRVRDWFGEGTRRAIPEPQVNLGLGYLLGQRTALPPDLEEQIKIVGLTHVVVASGYNLTILVVFARRLFVEVSKFLAVLCSGVMIISFMLITGLSPSMTRAGLVAGLSLLVWYYGRKTHPFVLLTFAAALTVFINPSYLWGDLGWYLSFGSFIGVIVLAPLIHNYFWGISDKAHILRQLTVETMSAQIMTMPVILLAFGTYSLYALPANIMVLPFVPLAMLFTFVAGIAGLAIPGLSDIFGLPAALLLRYSTEVIKKFANLPNAQNELTFNPALMLIGYILITASIIYMKRRTSHDFRGEHEKENL